jgi:hypothetical protein
VGIIGQTPDDPMLLSASEPPPPPAGGPPDHPAGRIEINLPSGARIRVDAQVNERALRRVLQAMRGVV